MVESKVEKRIIMATTHSIEGKKISKVLGLVQGNTVRARWFVRDIAARLKAIIGGEIGTYTVLLTRARNEATERMLEESRKMGADAIVSVRYETNSIVPGTTEILAYGTAVKLE